MADPVAFKDILDASVRLSGVAVRTPLLESNVVNALLGFRLLIKPENLQRTGSFKFRGAYNFVASLSPEQRRAGAVGFSSGNHAQGLALAAVLGDTPATIIMPSDAPKAKIEGARALGATVLLNARYFEDRDEIVRQIQKEQGATFIPPFDHPLIIAGQGSIGVEIAEDMRARDLSLDRTYIPCSGGGLAGGVALALSEVTPASKTVLVEPEGYDDFAISLKSGTITGVTEMRPTLCDGLRTPRPGLHTFQALSRIAVGTAIITDRDAMAAMAFLFRHFRIVAEPSGAASVAAALNDRQALKGRAVVAIVSGGNVDAPLFAEALRDHGPGAVA